MVKVNMSLLRINLKRYKCDNNMNITAFNKALYLVYVQIKIKFID